MTSWVKNGEELDPASSSRIRQTDTGNLVIQDAEQPDAGEYFCQATNLVGKRSSDIARLSVFVKPTTMMTYNTTARTFPPSEAGSVWINSPRRSDKPENTEEPPQKPDPTENQKQKIAVKLVQKQKIAVKLPEDIFKYLGNYSRTGEPVETEEDATEAPGLVLKKGLRNTTR